MRVQTRRTCRKKASVHTRGWRPAIWLVLVVFTLNPVLVTAQTVSNGKVLLKPGDEIRISAPGRPELARRVVLDAAGQAMIEPIGAVQLGGLTLVEATQRLKQKLRLFYPTLDALDVDMGQTGSVRIYLLGAVSQRGVLSFEAPPTLWELVRAIGGPLDNANLRDARVIREEDGGPKVYPVDLSGLNDGRGVMDFLMQDGDTLIIPTLLEGIPSVAAHDGVKVFGSVGVPTIVPIVEGTRLMDVLMLAGAPTENAKKTEIYWVHHDGIRNHATVVNLEKYLLEGDDLGNPLVYPGDTVSVEYKTPGWATTTLPLILGMLVAASTVFLAYDAIIND